MLNQAHDQDINGYCPVGNAELVSVAYHIDEEDSHWGIQHNLKDRIDDHDDSTDVNDFFSVFLYLYRFYFRHTSSYDLHQRVDSRS